MSESRFEFRLLTRIRQRGVAPVALVLYHEGTCHFVTQGSDAEIDLVDQGAVHIARVSFDPHPAPPSARNQIVEASLDDASLCWGSTHN